MSQLIFIIMLVVNPIISFVIIMIRLVVETRCRKKIDCKNDRCPFRSTCDKTCPSDKEAALITTKLTQLATLEEKEKSLNK